MPSYLLLEPALPGGEPWCRILGRRRRSPSEPIGSLSSGCQNIRPNSMKSRWSGGDIKAHHLAHRPDARSFLWCAPHRKRASRRSVPVPCTAAAGGAPRPSSMAVANPAAAVKAAGAAVEEAAAKRWEASVKHVAQAQESCRSAALFKRMGCWQRARVPSQLGWPSRGRRRRRRHQGASEYDMIPYDASYPRIE
jgi:hypothetical protein